ncbi:protein LHCP TRANSLOCATION DEFECT-like [Typha angustifolia]|uniref:protein LHCP TRANSLOCATION DEFECT-like n=1 Tax=Typha angustifolia TaxID=59011 RepID=UPI003C30C7FC
MASIPCSIQHFTSFEPTAIISTSSNRSTRSLKTPFLAITRRLGWLKESNLRAKVGSAIVRSRTTCWFRFGTSGVDAEGAGIYGSQSRNDFSHYDVEQYFDYMGMLAVEGSYDRVEGLLKQNIAPVDILLMMAASEGDIPKIEELLRAGASYHVKDDEGKTALDRAVSDEIKQLILEFSAQKV